LLEAHELLHIDATSLEELRKEREGDLALKENQRRQDESVITRNPILRWFGLIAYGTYLLHQPINFLCHSFLLPGAQTGALQEQIVTAAAFLLTVGLASLSWVYFEKRIITFGHSFKYRLKSDMAEGN
jgi:peptidoglycan/LPS O-acetylase OafA/YrhL